MNNIIKKLQNYAGVSRVALSANFESQMADLVLIDLDAPDMQSGYQVRGNVATIFIRGFLAPNVGMDYIMSGLTGYDILSGYIDMAQGDPYVDILRLDIDSNGGFADGADGIAQQLSAFTKPIETYVTGDMCSAAYMVGCVAQSIIATHPLCIIGSVGTYTTHTEYSKALEKEGVATKLFSSGYWKGAFNYFRPLSERESERLQREVDEVAARFFTIVADNRPLSIEQIKAFDGDYFNANDALTNGLIDEIGEIPMAEKAVSFTQEQMDEAVASATLVARAETQATIDRVSQIEAHSSGTAALKALMAGKSFAHLSVNEIKAALDVSMATPLQVFEQAGGAGVTVDPIEPPKMQDVKAQKAQASIEALEKLKAIKARVL